VPARFERSLLILNRAKLVLITHSARVCRKAVGGKAGQEGRQAVGGKVGVDEEEVTDNMRAS
jgi:hypothetical protein